MKTSFVNRERATTFDNLEIGDLFRFPPDPNYDGDAEDAIRDSFSKIYMKIDYQNQIEEEENNRCVLIADEFDGEEGIVKFLTNDTVVYPVDAILDLQR